MKKIVTVGYVGNQLVEAHEYPGKDSDLSFYIVNGKTYVGTARFTEIISRKTIKY